MSDPFIIKKYKINIRMSVIVAMKSRIGNDGSISKQAVVGSYDGKEAKIVTVERRDSMRYGVLDNSELAELLAVRANKSGLEERLRQLLGKTRHGRKHTHKQHHRRAHTHRRHHRRHHRRRHTKKHSHKRCRHTHKK
jgi:hypothetical protein